MRKLWLLIVILAAVFFSACSQAPASSLVEDSPAPPAATEAAPTPKPTTVAMECEIVSVSPTQGPTEASMFPPATAEDWVKGNEDATLTIMEYSDFQCPYCALLATDLNELTKKYPEDVRVVFRHFPLPSHPLALMGGYAAEAAGLQGKFWEMHDILFAEQANYQSMTEDQFQDWLNEQAAALELDQEKFVQDMQSEAITTKVDQARQHGLDTGIPGTPFVLLNGQVYQGPRDVASLESIMRMFELEDRQFTSCPGMEIDPAKQYIATIKTEKGDVVVQFYPDKAPLAVNSFVFLARQGWFDDITFHRVLPGFVAQSGDPSGTGFGGPGYSFADEITELKFDRPGLLGMANAGPGSNGSQFFITYAPVPDLDGKYTVFGEVIEGMDVVESLAPRNPEEQMNLPPGDKIISVEIQEQ